MPLNDDRATTGEGHLQAPRARIGMIIPSVNSMSEPQFNHFAPPGLGVHVARARVAGGWKRPLAAMAEEIATSAKLLSDVAPDLDRVPLHRHLDDAGTAGRRPHPGDRAGSHRHRGGRDQPAGARSAAGARAAQARPAQPLQEQSVRDRLSAGDRLCRGPRRGACARAARIRGRHAAGVDRARAPARPAGGRRHFSQLHQYHPDRGDRGYRARARQAGGQQQSGGAVGLREAAQVGARPACHRCRSSAG